jgi:uncharacterized protein (DUF342 family)
MNNDIKIENDLGFKLDTETGKLIAVVTHCNNKIELTSSIVKQRLKTEKLAHLFVSEYLVFELVRRYNNSIDGRFEVEIGEQRDAVCEISLSADKMKAYLSLSPNFGGKAITYDEIAQSLTDKNVIFGIDDEQIETLVEKGECLKIVIAKGEEPIAGIDTQFNTIVSTVRERKPFINEDGSVDYRELGDIVTVHKGDLLCERIPPVVGVAGKNVLGEIIKPENGKNTQFAIDKSSVYINPENSNQLLAAITGQPIPVENGVMVSPVLTLDKVDLETGNIRFDGTIFVKGDVLESMKVYALIDIIIEGNVVNSKIECMGNLIIKGGVTGNSQLIAGGEISVKGGVQGYQENNEIEKKMNPAKIVSYNSVSVGFAENFIIEADLDIVVEKYAMNSQLTAKNKIVAGRKGSGKKPSLMGGETWATSMVRAAIIGSEIGIKTRVIVGVDPFIKKRVDEIKKQLSRIQKEQQDIQKSLVFAEYHPHKIKPKMLERLHYTLEHLINNSEAYQAEYKELLSNMTTIESSRVIADRGVYVGTEIKIHNVWWHAQENRGKSVFTLVRDKIVINTR